MQKEFDLLPLYNYERLSEDKYKFITNNDVSYIVIFSISNVEFTKYPSVVYEISFYTENKLIKTVDKKISNTIVYLIYQYLSIENTSALLFICESSDKKQNARKKLFEKWFLEFNNGQFEKFDAELQVMSDELYFNSLITSKENPFKNILLEAYIEALEVYKK